MRSFLGRDILSLREFERAEFERVFEVCDELAPIARSRRNSDLLASKTLLTAFYQPSTRTRMATEAAWPLKRAFDAVLAHTDPGALLYASRHRSEFMWPWEHEPHSVAHGILDDETYDWLAVVDGMLTTGGAAVVVGESTLERANALAREATGIAVDPTGSSGLAGLLALREAGGVGDEERVALLFTGVSRSDANHDKEERHEELSGARHPVAQEL